MIFGLQPFGVSPFGVATDGTDLSVSDPLEGLLRDPSVQRTILVYAEPLKIVTKLREAVKLGDGFASQEDDTLPDGTNLPHALFKAGLLSPWSYQSRVMSDGQLSNSGQTSRGDVTVENVTGRMTVLKRYEWDEAPTQMLLGRPENRLEDFTTVFNGVTGAINLITPDNISIPLLDNSYLLQTPIVRGVYRGMGAAIRGNGTTGYASGTLTSPAGSMTLELYVRPKTSALTQKGIVGWKNGSLAGGRELRFASGAINNLPQISIVNDAGTTYTLSASSLTSSLLLPHWSYYIAYILDTVANTLTLIIQLDENDSTNDQVQTMAVVGPFNTTLSNFTLFRTPGVSSNYLDADIDELRIWNDALDIETLRSYRGIQIDASHPQYVNLYSYFKFNEGTGPTIFNSVSGGVNLSYTGGVSWVGSLEGDSSLTAQLPPLWEGIRRQVEPVNVDSQNYVYEVSRNPTAVTVTDVSDSGDPTYINDGTISDIYDWSPVAGHCIVSYMGGRTLLRLAAPPQGTLTVTVIGDTLDTAGIVKKLAKTYKGFNDSQIDLVAFAAMTVNYPASVGIGLRLDNADVWDLMSQLAYRAGGWVRMTRSGILTIKVLEEPTTAKYCLDENDVVVDSVEMETRTLAASQTKLNYRLYQTTQDASNLATSLDPATKLDLAKPTRPVSTPLDNGVLAARSSAKPLIQDTFYDDESETLTEAVRRQRLWGVNRVSYSLQLTRGMFLYDVGDVIQLDIKDQSGTGTYVEDLHNRVGMIVDIQEDSRSGAISLIVWCREVIYEYLITDTGSILTTDSDEGLIWDVS